MLEAFENIMTKINDLIWGLPMIILLFGTHIYLTFRTGFVQKYIFKGIKLSLNKEVDAEGEISPFQALTTALASTIGTGNIIGVSTAIVSGGPGAVFWTWMTGIFGIATKYVETFIAVKYRKKQADGTYVGGAMTALEHLNLKWLGVFFAIITALASLGIGCGVQSNAISDILQKNYNLSPYLIGAVLSISTILVILGGVKSIAKVCQMLVPVMSFMYIAGCIYILIYNCRVLPETIELIIKSAFTPSALAGGFAGSTMMVAARYGIARGLFSNESGLGSSPIVSASSSSRNAVKTALIGATGTFWDTVVVCAITGLVLVSSVISNPNISTIGLEGGELSTLCFAQIPYIGTPLLIFGVITFAFSTILGWCVYAEKCLAYMYGKEILKYYRLLWSVVVFLGAVVNLSLIWKISDALNVLMVIPNLVAMLLLVKIVAKDTKYYLSENHLDEYDTSLE